jgi:beta-galactosidase
MLRVGRQSERRLDAGSCRGWQPNCWPIPRDACVRSGSRMIVIVLALSLSGCSPSASGSRATLAPTLGFENVSGGRVAFQSGIPVPSFAYQEHPRLDLDGSWRFEAAALDATITFLDRKLALAAITREAAGRQAAAFDDRNWQQLTVPGAFAAPPDPTPTGGWYRRPFFVPPSWGGKVVTLKFESAHYVADVWLNGHYLGYHEGGSTPFAFDATPWLLAGDQNLVAVRVVDPAWGTRNDIVPWARIDWWNYGGLTGHVWLEGQDSLLVSRADVIPHLDSADVSVVVENRGGLSVGATEVTIEVLPARVTTANVTNPSALSLVPVGAEPISEDRVEDLTLTARSVVRLDTTFVFFQPDLWTPSTPALYVLRVAVSRAGRELDVFYDSFGLRKVSVDQAAPRLLLNGLPVAFNGVALQEERVWPARQSGDPQGGPIGSVNDELRLLEEAATVNANFIRADHRPADPTLLYLADRLGIAIWEEIPLYHYTPETFQIALGRGIAQQMLAEMDLRDFNRASVLFHGLSNESSGDSERAQAMKTLLALDREIDGSRLVGQAVYGTRPDDPTSTDLDVAGYTFYYGVFYGNAGPAVGTSEALAKAHAAYPHKPIMVLEFGRWADNPAEEKDQAALFDSTYPVLASHYDTVPGGYLAASVWWTLDDYWTDRPGIDVEHFGLFRPDGTERSAGEAAANHFAEAPGGRGTSLELTSGGRAIPVHPANPATLVVFVFYGLGFCVLLVGLLVGLTYRSHVSGAW